MAVTTQRLLETSKGRSVLSNMTDKEAIAICASLTNDTFAQDLVRKWHTKRGLSHDQMVWAHIKAQPQTPQLSLPIIDGNYSGIVDMFKVASSRLKRPRFVLNIENTPIVFSLASPQSRNPGCVYVNNGSKGGFNTYYGKITPEGTFQPAKECNGDILRLLAQVNANPSKMAAEYGHKTGRCCFCSLKLTDPRSVDVGYGPVCAKNFGLPYG